MSKIFSNVYVRNTTEGCVYQGLRPNFLDDWDCTTDEIKALAIELGFMDLTQVQNVNLV